MKLKIGDRVRVRINKIQENGCYCSLGQGYLGFMPNVLMPSFIDEKGHCTNAVNEIVDVVIYDIKNNGFILLSDEIKFMEKNRDNKVKNKEMAVAGAGLMLLEDPNFVLGTNREIKSQPEDGYILPLNLKVKIGDKEYPISTAIKVSDKLRDVAKSSGRYQWSDDDLSIFWATEEEVSKAIARGATKNPRRLLNGESILIEVLAAFAAIPYAANNVQVGNVQVGIVRDEKFVKNREPIFKNVDLSTLDKAMAFIKELEAQKAASEIKGQQSPILAYTNEDGRINNFSIARACDTRSFARIKRDIEKNYPNYKFDRFEVIAGTEDKKPKKIAEQEKNRVFVSSNEPGTVFEAEVVRVQNSKVIIQTGDIQGIVKKEDTNWNEIDRLEDLLFEGETIKAVYIKHENDQLFFSLKQLNDKPYDEKLYDLSLKDLLNYIGHDTNLFIGQAKQYHYGLFIENLYSTSIKQKGKLLIDPIFGYNLRSIVPNANFNVEENKYYKVELNLVPKNKRLERNQLFQFVAKNIEETENPYKADVDLTFAKSTSPRDCAALAHTLAEVGKNMYSSKDRMFFELIQNADDAAAQKGVSINVKTQGDFLIVRHNGFSFDKDDFDAITSSANGTKKANENKTGYKGIGFKSVFTDSEMVLIKTGGYQFKFDKNYPLFTNFEEFYFRVNSYTTEQQKCEFLQKFSSERNKFRGVADIPWQLEPIWIDDYPTELGEEFAQSNVALALKLGESKILGDNGYDKAIADIISNPRFMLFLRNTKRIDFNELSVSKNTKDGIITLKNSFGTNRIEYFKREDFEIDVNNELFEKYDIDVRIVVEEIDENSGKIIEAKFVDTHNNELENIPKKIAINNSTTLSFAILIDENGITKPNTKCNEISMFAFLPTLVKDFKFPFYINANFILDPPRQRILGDNPWNFYLMQEIARHLVKWSASLNERQDKNALNVLLSEYFEEDSADTKQLAEHFNSAYKSALESESFILNYKGELAKQNEIIIDKTGLSEIVGFDLFCHLLQTEKCLPSEKIDSKILEEDIFEHIKTLKFDDVIEAITNNSDFNDWFVSATDEQKKALYKWIEDNNIKTREDKLKSFVSNLPLFQFAEDYKSCEEIGSSEYIITTEHIEPIKGILSKLGFVCSDNLFNESHPLYEYIELPLDEVLFKLIKESEFSGLSAVERKMLFFALADFDGVGDAKLKEIALFKNMNGEFKPLGEMVAYRENVPAWLSEYVLCKEDYSADLASYLISQEEEFKNIIQEHIGEIDAPITELYKTYKDKWTGQFTRQIIDRYEIDDDILTIIEESDTQTKEYFLNSIKQLELFSTSYYKKNSYEYRVLQLALSVYKEPSDFSSKIYFDGQCIKDFSVSDDVVCEYTQNGETKKVKMSLAKLLPQYHNQSDSIDKIKALFESKKDLDKFFETKSKSVSEVHKELNQHLAIPESFFSEWNGEGNALQFLFATYYRRQKKGWNNLYVPKIDLNNESDEFVYELLEFLFDNSVSIKESPFTYHLKKYFVDKYFDSDFIFENEQILPIIEQWANDDKKKKYLIDSGVRTEGCYAIQFRKLFLENKPIDFIDKLEDEEINFGIEFIATGNGIERPFVGENQRDALIYLKDKCKDLHDEWDEQKMHDKSQEWHTKEYEEWIKGHNIHIYIYPGLFPSKLSYKEVLLLNYEDADCRYYYSKEEHKLFVSNKQNMENVLLEVVKEGESGLDFDDYKFLCLEGKISISREDIEKKDKKIKTLSEENRKKDEIIEQYRAKYGDLREEVNGSYNASGPDDIFNSSANIIHSFAQDELNKQSGRVIERDGLSREEQIIAHKEAEQVVREKLEADGYDCSNWITDDDEESKFKKWKSVNQVPNIIDPDGQCVNLVIKSAKAGYIYLSATDFEFLTSNCNNVLMVWDGKNVHSVTADDIFNKDSNVNLIFDTEYTPKHYFAALSKVFQYIKRTTFAVKNPSYNPYDTIKSFGMDSKTEGIQDLFDDNDL